MYSFVDGFLGYNQIMMLVVYKLKTTFITMWGVFCYRVMPFRLKNVEVTYQRMAVTMFYDMMHKEVEICVDDIIVKTTTFKGHAEALDRSLERVEKNILRLNYKKCIFRVTSG